MDVEAVTLTHLNLNTLNILRRASARRGPFFLSAAARGKEF